MSFRLFAALSINFANFCAEYECQTSRPGKVQNRIVGGFDCSMTEYPFFILITKSGSQHCGGSIVHQDWVLSAAHCFYMLSSPADIELQSNEENRTATKIVIHPEYNGTVDNGANNNNNDIGMVKFSSQVLRSFDKSNAIKLPSSPSVTDGCQTALKMGWGRQKGTILPARPLKNKTGRAGVIQVPNDPRSFKCVHLDITRGELCSHITHDMKPGSIFCTSWPEAGKGTCSGDSGGPVVCEEDSGGSPILIGIVSSGFGCALPIIPNINMRVDYFLDFIRDTINAANINGKSLILLFVCIVASCAFIK